MERESGEERECKGRHAYGHRGLSFNNIDWEGPSDDGIEGDEKTNQKAFQKDFLEADANIKQKDPEVLIRGVQEVSVNGTESE